MTQHNTQTDHTPNPNDLTHPAKSATISDLNPIIHQDELFDESDMIKVTNDPEHTPESAETFHDTQDSYIYGDADATDEDTIETMTVYDPDADRLEDIEQSGDNETVICYAYSRKTGAPIEPLAIEDVSRTLTNNNQFIWLGLYDPSLETVQEVQDAFDLHELALEDAFADHQRPKVESYGNDTIFVVVRTAKLEDNQIRYGTTAIFMGKISSSASAVVHPIPTPLFVNIATADLKNCVWVQFLYYMQF